VYFYIIELEHIKMKRKQVALIAHDNKKAELVEWVEANKDLMSRCTLYATGTTGRIIEEKTAQPVTKLKSGPLGGDQQIGALIADGKIDLLVFFWDPLEPSPHDPDIKALLRIAVVWNIPVACNRSTADYLFTSSLLFGDYERKLPDYKEHVGRKL